MDVIPHVKTLVKADALMDVLQAVRQDATRRLRQLYAQLVILDAIMDVSLDVSIPVTSIVKVLVNQTVPVGACGIVVELVAGTVLGHALETALDADQTVRLGVEEILLVYQNQ